MPELPLLSVVIPTKNRARYIERAIKSVLAEIETDYANTEFWVVDGGSTDGTVEILQKYAGHLQWISEPDKGVSDACNKILPHLKGKYVRWIGDDDRLYPNNFSHMIAFAEAHPEIDIVGAQATWLLEAEDGSAKEKPWNQPEGPISFEDMLGLGQSLGILTPESCLTRLDLYHRVGGLDLAFHYWAYWEFWLRALQRGAKFHVLPERVMERIQTPLSDGILGQKPERVKRWKDEMNRILLRYGGRKWIWWHRCGGRLTAGRVMYYLVAQVCQKTHFHPRSLLRKLLGRRSTVSS
jgi:glycosyltransferase involved in cell wall biosynthesis